MSSPSKQTEAIRKRKAKPNKANQKKNQKRMQKNAEILAKLSAKG